jgi:hypothetical protein
VQHEQRTDRHLRSPLTLLAPLLVALGVVIACLASAQADEQSLVSRHVCDPPVVDGRVEPLWQQAPILRLQLTYGHDGVSAYNLGLRALHTDQDIYFLARWPGSRPTGEPRTVANKLTVHWRLEPPGAVEPTATDMPPAVACTVACHTVFARGDGRVAYANAETIPQGGDEGLRVAGGWSIEGWTVEWSRPLRNANPYDLQLDDLSRQYSFLVKVFEAVEGRADLVSSRATLVFAR